MDLNEMIFLGACSIYREPDIPQSLTCYSQAEIDHVNVMYWQQRQSAVTEAVKAAKHVWDEVLKQDRQDRN